MCSNFQPIKYHHNSWLTGFQVQFASEPWRDEVYPSYPEPFVYLENEKTKVRSSTIWLGTALVKL